MSPSLHGSHPLEPGRFESLSTHAEFIVAVGASAGALNSFRKFFAHLPAKSGMGFVVAYHADPQQQSLMPELLSAGAPVPVVRAEEGMAVEADHVYVLPPGTRATMRDARIHFDAPDSGDPHHPIDALFQSLAADQGPHAAGVVLTGTGTDGTQGIHALKDRGGFVLAESVETAQYDGMPRSALSTGLVDRAAPVEALPGVLIQHAADLHARPTPTPADPQQHEIRQRLDALCALLRSKTGNEFGRYKPTTLVRRVQHRLQMLGIDAIDVYLERLAADPDEPGRLEQDLLISVTRFFRDPDAFQALDHLVVKALLQKPGMERGIRVWVPGCATGEEAYSIAMLLRERAEALPRPPPSITVFATDIDKAALDVAREGRYPDSIVGELGPERLERHFTREGNGWQVQKGLRDLCIFAEQSVIKDPPFARIDLVSCRNLLIYLEAPLQRQLLPLFHYALNPGGYLFLGPSENAVDHLDLFRPLDKKHRIFQHRDAGGRALPDLSFLHPDVRGTEARSLGLSPRQGGDPLLARTIERVLIEKCTPPAAVVTHRGKVVYMSGPIGRHLELPQGLASLDLLELARSGLRPELRNAFQAAVSTRKPTRSRDVRLSGPGGDGWLRIEVRPLHEYRDPSLFLVLFYELQPPAGLAKVRHRRTGKDPQVAELEVELDETRQHLNATVEELEHANQEMRLSNEELLSLNEELQSANEELQTSKEEMQSVNEELGSVNAELQAKLDELAAINGDLQNLFRATQIATVFLDRGLRIKRFTPASRDLFSLIDADVNRPIRDIATHFDNVDLPREMERVLRTLEPCERDVASSTDHKWFAMRILPYRTVSDVIDGVVLTFSDITALKQAEAEALRARDELEQRVADRTAELAQAVKQLQQEVATRTAAEQAMRQREEEYRAMFEVAPVGKANLSACTGRFLRVNRQMCVLLGLTESALLQSTLLDHAHPSDRGRLQAVLRELSLGQVDQQHIEVELVSASGAPVKVVAGFGVIRSAEGTPVAVSAVVDNMTERRQLEEQLSQARKMESIGLLAGGIAHDFNNILTGVLGFAEMTMAMTADDNIRSNLSEIVAGGQRAASLTRQLLAFARRQTFQPRVVNLAELLLSTEKMLRRLLGPNIELVILFHAEHLPACVDPAQVEQIIVNLAINASDAMKSGGRLTIEIGEVELGDRIGSERVGMTPGRYGLLTVSDNGVGMSEHELAHCFEPFFTTKEMGRGTGLGLATVYGSVTQAGGHILAESSLGRGTTIRVYLPLTQLAEEKPTPPPVDAADLRGDEVILLVDDVSAVLRVTREILNEQGYHVLFAPDGIEALAVADRHEGPIDLLITDVMMPLVGGRELAQRIVEKRPDTQVLFISGFSEELSLGDLRGTRQAFLPKPFTRTTLLQKVRAILDARVAPSQRSR